MKTMWCIRKSPPQANKWTERRLFGLTLISVVVYVSDCSDALSEVSIESVVTSQNTFFLHHPLKKTAVGVTHTHTQLAGEKKKLPLLNRCCKIASVFLIIIFCGFFVQAIQQPNRRSCFLAKDLTSITCTNRTSNLRVLNNLAALHHLIPKSR